ncbi:MAG TPA: glycosyl hydrolase 115 family protein [Candidatus Dormibacteraeota bacterium]|nr:glycosyl hydrolase 115 family protein [Candidatus Dormibacteraeota bacterium]
MPSARNESSTLNVIRVLRSAFVLVLLFLLPAIGFGRSSILFEAENLSPTGSGQTITTGADVAASGGVWVKIMSTAIGQWIEFTTPNIPAGTYQLSLAYRTNPTRAQHNVQLDGNVIGGTIDQYAPSPSFYVTVPVDTVTFSSSTTHVLRLTATGKDAASTSYEVSADAFTFALLSGGGGQVAAPAFNPPAGVYTNSQTVTLTTATTGASIRYTFDGAVPNSTNGLLYSGPVVVTSSVNLKAIAYQGGMTDSFVSNSTYTISSPPASYMLPPGVPIFFDGSEAPAIKLAIQDLQRDLRKVLGAPSPVVNSEPAGPAIIVTCQGPATAAWRDSSLTGLESHILSAAGPASAPRIVLQGADVRGTLYALYEFSDRLLNIPPLWYWASWSPPVQTSLLVASNLNVRINSSVVRYRGWFPNDLDLLSPWMNASTNNYNALFETLLRLKYNVLDVDHISDVGGANTGLQWARTCRDRGIVVAFTHYTPLGGSVADYGSVVGGSPNVTNIAGLRQFWTHYINLAASNNLSEVIQSIVFRGNGDQAWWNAIGGDPGTSQGRADIVSQMMSNQMSLLRSITGNPHPVMRTVFYSEVGDFMDHYNTPAGFNMNPPVDPDLIWCPSSDQRDHYPTPDTTSYNYLNYQSGHNPFGYYFNFQFYTTGSHLAAGEGPWKATLNHQIASQKAGSTNFVCSVLNAGNVREFTMELAAGGDMLWNLGPGYDSGAFVQSFCTRYFGAANAPAVSTLISNYYAAFWAQKKSDTTTFPTGFPRQFVFQDLRYARAAEVLLANLSSRAYNPNPFDAQGPRYFRVTPTDCNATDEVHATINGSTAAITNFTALVSVADSLYPNLPPASQPYFNDIVRQPAHLLLQCNLFLQGLSQGAVNIPNGNAAVHPWVAQAQSACLAMRDALNNTTQGPVFSAWYASESKFNLSNLQNQINVVVGQYPSRPFFQTPSAAGGNLALTGAGGAGNGVYYLLSATNVAMPFNTWSVIATNNFDISGAFSLSVPLAAASPQRFYVIKLP